jgi:hypothetical protein
MHHMRTGCTWIVAAALIVLETSHAADPPPSSQPVTTSVAPKRILDLKAPNINSFLTPEQIQRVLSATIDPDIERVEVEDSREKLIDEGVPLWRSAPSWVLPRSAEDVSKKYGKPDATQPYRPPAAGPAPMAGESRGYDR